MEVCRAELIAAISLASDLGMGHPLETGLATAVVAIGLARRLELPEDEVARVRDLALLQHVGCSATAHEAAGILGDDLLMRSHAAMLDFANKKAMTVFMVQHVNRAYSPLRRPAGFLKAMANGQRLLDAADDVCESAVMLARRFRYDAAHLHDLECVYENWDGTGFPGRVAGEEITVSARICSVALLAVLAHRHGGVDPAELVRSRAGHVFDPLIAGMLVRDLDELLAPVEGDESLWTLVVGTDDEPADTDGILRAVADFVDLKSPYLHGHSAGVARLAAAAGEALGLPPDNVTDLRRAGWVHDVGRVGVSSGIWSKPGHLTPHEQEQVRLHPYLTDRVLQHSPYLSHLAATASAHHERLDGSGYHRGLPAAALGQGARILAAAADVFRTKVEERPHRPALTPAVAAKELKRLVESGRLDRRAVEVVLAAAGEYAGRPARVAGLTPREVETLRNAASGLSIKQIARAMTISPKTVDGNLQRIYTKIGVSTRAGATLFALQHDLLGPPGNREISP